MTVSVETRLAALRLAQHVRLTGVRERNALADAPPSTVLATIRKPTEALGAMRLGTFLKGSSTDDRGLIPRVGPTKIAWILRDASATQVSRRLHPAIRLRELTAAERERLCESVLRHAPRTWTTQASREGS